MHIIKTRGEWGIKKKKGPVNEIKQHAQKQTDHHPLYMKHTNEQRTGKENDCESLPTVEAPQVTPDLQVNRHTSQFAQL